MTGSTVRFAPGGALRGVVRVPSDKSITHRALMVAALCEEPVVVRSPLWAGDTLSTARCLRALGVGIDRLEDFGADVARMDDVSVRGVGLDGLRAPAQALDAGNAGTAVRLLAGMVSGGRGRFRFVGDASLSERPMRRILLPLRSMGVVVEARDDQYLPLTVTGGPVQPITYRLPVASAQVKSCVLLAGLHADGATTVVEPTVTRDHTERLLSAAGARLERQGDSVVLDGRPRLSLPEVVVPGDASSAAFLVAAAALVPGSDLRVSDVGLNPTRIGFFEVLREMGAHLEWELTQMTDQQAEPVGDIQVTAAPLQGVQVPPERIPALIDEVPLLALVACFAEGETSIAGVAELRVKESDRLAAVTEIIAALGGEAEVADDVLVVRPRRLVGGRVDARGDHRLALLGAVAGLLSPEGVQVQGFDAAEVSFPRFETMLREVSAT